MAPGPNVPERPEILPGCQLFWFAYEELNSCRLTDYGPIPSSAIRVFCDDYEIFGDQRDELQQLVRAMDVAYLKHLANKQKSASAAPLGKKKK